MERGGGGGLLGELLAPPLRLLLLAPPPHLLLPLVRHEPLPARTMKSFQLLLGHEKQLKTRVDGRLLLPLVRHEPLPAPCVMKDTELEKL